MKKFIYYFLSYLCSILTYVVPKKKGFYFFIPFQDKKKFSGHVKSLILYANQYCKKVDPAVFIFSDKAAEEAEKCGVRYARNYLKGVWLAARAEHIIIDASTFFFRYGKFSIVQLWHGTGYKNIALLNNNASKSHIVELKKHYRKYDLIVATSESDKKRKNESFGSNKAIITGSPRNDLFFNSKASFLVFRKKYNIEKYNEIIAYTPTYRDFETSPPFTERFWQQLQEYLVENNTLFVIKKHPWDKYLTIPTHYSHIKDLSHSISDVQELLAISDILISDYSGIMSDFVITGKPIFIYAYDFYLYMNRCRSMYYDLGKVLPKPFITDEQDLLNKIKDRSWLEKEDYQKSYEHFKQTFHFYLDGNACERVMAEIQKLK